MATDNKIVWFGLGAVTAVLLLRYYNKNKGLMVEDIQKDASKVLKSAQDNLNPTKRAKRNGVLEIRDIKNAPKAEVKEPISVPVRNLIPSVYDTGVGEDIFANMSGPIAPTSMQGACKCADTHPKRYRTLHLNPNLS
jgi:hypothetical protein